MPTAKKKTSRSMSGENQDSTDDSPGASSTASGRPIAHRRNKNADAASSLRDDHPDDGPNASGEAGAQSRPKHVKMKSKSTSARSPTSTEERHQREADCAEAPRHRQDNLRPQREQALAKDAMAGKESETKLETLMGQIFDQIEGFEALSSNDNESSIRDFLIDLPVLESVHSEVHKLKSWQKLHEVDADRLAKLVQLLEKNICDVIDEEGQLKCRDIFQNDDVDNESTKELWHERLIRASFAASTSMLIMAACDIPKEIVNEDTVEQSMQLCKLLLTYVVYPAVGTNVPKSNGKGAEAKSRRGQCDGEMLVPWFDTVCIRVADIISCFSEFIRIHKMDEVAVVQLSVMASAPFFVDKIGVIHQASIQLLSTIFRQYENLRTGVVHEIFTSIHKIPSNKNPKNCYPLSNNNSIHNFTALLLQLVQSVVVIPSCKRTVEGEQESVTEATDSTIVSGVNEAKKWARILLNRFFRRSTAKGEDSCRRSFESFFHDLLSALDHPDWPAAQLMVKVLGSLLVESFRNKKLESSVRTASLNYLGTITTRLRKDVVEAFSDETKRIDKLRLDNVIRKILHEEYDDPTKLLEDIDTSAPSYTEKMQKLQQALFDYIVATKRRNDRSAEYAVSFYIGEWYKSMVEDVSQCREILDNMKDNHDGDCRLRLKEEKRLKKIIKRAEFMKNFWVAVVDNYDLKKPIECATQTKSGMVEEDVCWAVKYLTMNNEFLLSFDVYLQVIVEAAQFETAVSLRTKAMRILTGIIETDSDVLTMPQVTTAIHSRLRDTNAVVREATLELIGKHIVSRPNLFDNYYVILNDRIHDIGISVRKRVLRIFRDYIEKMPTNEKVPAIIAKILLLVADSEEGVRKLAFEVLTSYLFVPLPVDQTEMTERRIETLVDSVNLIIKGGKTEVIENLMATVLKKDDLEHSVLTAAQQNADALVTYIQKWDNDCAALVNVEGITPEQKVEAEKPFYERRLAAFTILSKVAKVHPGLIVEHVDMLVPYLTPPLLTSTDKVVLNHVIKILGCIVPLIEHPSDHFLNTVDERMCAMIESQGMLLIESAIACIGTVLKHWPKFESRIVPRVQQYIGYLHRVRTEMSNAEDEKDRWIVPAARIQSIRRILFSVGPLCRFIDFDGFNSDRSAGLSCEKLSRGKKKAGRMVQDVYSLLMFYSKATNADVSPRAIGAIGHICAEYPEFFDRQELRDMYNLLLRSRDTAHSTQKCHVLRNLSLFLMVEEERILKASENYRKMRAEQGDIEGDELSVVDTRGSSRFGVIQVFWGHILASYITTNVDVRNAASLVVYQTMHQGLVTASGALPTMVAMTSDPRANIRLPMEVLLKETDAKFDGMLAPNVTRGIRQAFALYKCLASAGDQKTPIRGFRSIEQCPANLMDENGLPKQSIHAAPLLNALYNCLRTTRRQRRNFISSVVHMLSDDYHDYAQELTIEEYLFVADNLATFPYQMLDEPLYLIHVVDRILAASGHNVLIPFKFMLTPKQPGELNSEDEEFKPENLFRRLPEDMTPIYDLMKTYQSCTLLMCIRTYLMKLYRLTDSKVRAYSPSDTAKIYEKPIVRQTIPIFHPELTVQALHPDSIQQRNTAEGRLSFCEQISGFRTIFYSLSVHESSDDGNLASIPMDNDSDDEPEVKRKRR